MDSALLRHAASKGHTERVQQLLAQGADVDAPCPFGAGTCLPAAAGAGHAQVVQLLLAAGADIGAVDRTNCTPLHKAVVKARHEVVQLLLAAGADVNAAPPEDEPLRGGTPYVQRLKQVIIKQCSCC